jgi:hypothetical protein
MTPPFFRIGWKVSKAVLTSGENALETLELSKMFLVKTKLEKIEAATDRRQSYSFGFISEKV